MHEQTAGQRPLTSALLHASHLTKRFGGRVAVSDVCLSLYAGEVVVLLGPNGAGKTTMLRLLAGLLHPTSGSVSIDGVTQSASSWPAARSRVGFLTEVPGLWGRLTVEANLLTFARLHGVSDPRRRVASLLGDFGVEDRATDPAGSLSKGMQQKVALIRSLLHEPPIVLLDEPTAGLDPDMVQSVRQIIKRLRSQGRAILVSTHDLSEAERFADRVAVLGTTLLALDHTPALRRRFGKPIVEIELACDAARLAVRLDQGLVSDVAVSNVAVSAQTITCRVGDLDTDVPRVVNALVAAGAAVRAVRPYEPSLEDIYLALAQPARDVSRSAGPRS